MSAPIFPPFEDLLNRWLAEPCEHLGEHRGYYSTVGPGPVRVVVCAACLANTVANAANPRRI